MPTLPINRSTNNTPSEHVDDHNAIHQLYNSIYAAVAAAAPGQSIRRSAGTAFEVFTPSVGGSPAEVASSRKTDTNYVLSLLDAGTIVEMNVAGANTVTIPTDASVPFPVGTVIGVLQYGVGQTTIGASVGVNLRYPEGLKIGKQYGSATLRKIAADEWEAQVAISGVKDVVLVVPITDETTAITTLGTKYKFRLPFALTLTAVRASANVASTSGSPVFDILEAGVSILSTKITLDVGEKTSVTAAVQPVISDTVLADDAEISFEVTTTGTGVAGVKISLIGVR